MITIGQFTTPEEAHLAKIKLGFHGIDSYLANEYLVQNYWLYSNAVGGVCLEVKPEDEEQAVEILRGDPGKAVADSGETESSFPPCPSCGAREVTGDRVPRAVALITMFFFGFPAICLGRRLKCGSCHHSWRHRSEESKRGDWQFLGVQIMIPGIVLILVYLVAALEPIIVEVWKLAPSRPIAIPLLVPLAGLCLVIVGYLVARPKA